MHGGKGREGMALSGSASYHLNGSGSGSGPHGGLPPPPGFELLSNPNVSVHSNVRVSSMDTSFQVEEQNPSPNYTHGINTAVKRKRGRPPKYKTLALSPMSSKVSPGSITLSTPTRKRSKGRLQGSGRKQQLASLVTKEKEDCKRAHGETVLRPCAAEKEGIDKIHEEMNNVGLKERYEECTKRVLELETELQDAKIRLEISECRADKILREKEEKISKLQVENGNLAAELEEARRTIKFFENASKESSKFENFGPKETPEVDIIISSPCKVKHPKERDSRFMETEDSGAFIWQDKNMTISISDTESPPRNNQISNNELESPAPQPQSIGVPLEISSSTEEAKPIVDQLSRLRPPQEQGPSDVLPPGLLEQSMDLVGRVKSFLAEQLTSTTTSDLNKMIDRANKAFATLDWCLADYRSFHCDVRDFIRCRSDRLSAEEERNGHAYAEIVSWHKDLLNQSNDAEEELSNAELELRSAIEKLEPLKNEIVKVRDLLRQLEKEMSDKELKIEDLKGKRDSCDDAFSNAEMEAKKMWWRRREIDERVKAAVEGDEKMKDRLRSYILSGQNISKGF